MLGDLGDRICILGPSDSGKSTLAQAVSKSRDLPPVHLDQLHHQAGTDWVPRLPEEFAALHDAAIQAPRWVMEGNYSRLLPQRLERATGFILLDASTPVSLYRYVRRCWFERDRPGALEGGRDSVKWEMLLHICGATMTNRIRYDRLFHDVRLPKIQLDSAGLLEDFYRANGLTR